MNPLRLLLFLFLAANPLAAEPPGILNHQGRIHVGGSPFDGAGSFKFALVDAAGTTTFWSNDGTSAAGAEPTAAVPLTVTAGRYSVALGDTSLANMSAAIPATVFADNAEVFLRIWFDDGANGSQLLTPDQRLGAVGYALTAGSVAAANVTGSLATGQLPSEVLLDGASGVNLTGNFSGDGSGLTGISIEDADADPTNELQDLAGVLASGNDAGGANMSGLGTVTATAFVGDGSGLTGIDSTRLTGPLATSLLFDKIGQVGNLAEDVVVSGNYAYVASFTRSLRIYDVSTPAMPVNVGSIDDSEGIAYALALSGNHVYLATSSDGLRIYDITDPTNPVNVAHIDNGGHARDVAVVGNYAYVANFDDGLRIYDITDPTNPVNVGHFNNGERTQAVAVSGNYAYLGMDDDGLRICDISDATNPFSVGHIDDLTGSSDDARGVAVVGDRAYVACVRGGLRIYDISVPENPVNLSHINDVGPNGAAEAVTVSGDYAYLAYGQEGVRVYNIANPANPVNVGGFKDGAYFLGPDGKGVAVVGDLVYVAFGSGGLRIHQVSDAVSAENFLGSFAGEGSGLTGIDLSAQTVSQALDLGGNDLTSAGTVTATAFAGDGSGLTGTGDDLGNHTATTDLNLNGNWLTNGTGNRGLSMNAAGSTFIQTNPGTIGMQLRSGNGPGLRFYQDNSRGWGEYTWDIAANEANFFVRDLTNASALPFRIKSGSSSNRIVVDGHNVGIGLESPTKALEVAGDMRLNGEDPILDFYDATVEGRPRRSYIETVFAPELQDPGFTAADQKIQFHVSNNNGTNTSRVLTLLGDGTVSIPGQAGIGTAAPQTPLEVEDSVPEIRLTDGRASSGEAAGTELGKISWYSRDTSAADDYDPVAAIEVVSDNNTVFPDGRFLFRTGTNGALNTRMVISEQGSVGIGTTNPTRGKLEIQGQSGTATLSYGYLNSSGNTGTASATNAYSVYATNRIAAQEFRAHSDRRIKKVRGISDAGEDLQTLMQIEVTDYTLRDTVANGDTPKKKIIAQQVAEVYPQAVTTDLTEVVPDIYQRAGIADGWVKLATDLKPGERVKLISEAASEVHEVLAVREGAFQVDWAHQGEVFVYGREVDDFHTVDYEAISMLNVSATQEQQRVIEKQQAEIASLKGELESLKEIVSVLAADSKKSEMKPVASH